MKGVTIDESLEQTFGSVDCHYLLLLLKHGYLGVSAFLILTATVLLKLGRIAFQYEKPQAALAAGLLGSLSGVAFLLVSVWFSGDFAGVWLFSAGVASSLQSLVSQEGSVTQSETPAEVETKIETKRRSRCLTPAPPQHNEERHEVQSLS